MISQSSETEPLTIIKTAELPRYVTEHPIVILAISSAGFFPRTGHELIAEAHHDAVFVGIDDQTIDGSDDAGLVFMSDQHSRLGTPYSGAILQGHYLFLGGRLAAYETFAVDLAGAAASVLSGLLGCWFVEKVESPRVIRGVRTATNIPLSLASSNLAHKFDHAIASWRIARSSKALKRLNKDTGSNEPSERSEPDAKNTKASRQARPSAKSQTAPRRSSTPVCSTPSHPARSRPREEHREKPLKIGLESPRSSRHHTRKDPTARRRTLLKRAYLTLRSSPEDSYHAIRHRRRILLERHRSGRVEHDLPSSHRATAALHEAWQRICDHKGWKP